MTTTAITKRGITRLVHFTTSLGIAGILTTKTILSRQRLPQEHYLEFIFTPNSKYRKDQQWLDYVNLSIEHINADFFDICSGSWHANLNGFWCVIELDPVIAAHEGVYFATTNNFYPSCSRGTGRSGLEALYAPQVAARYGTIVMRGPSHRPADPTCPQAEVLYPGAISTSFIRRIHVKSDDDAAAVWALCVTLNHPEVEIVVNPAMFRRRP